MIPTLTSIADHSAALGLLYEMSCEPEISRRALIRITDTMQTLYKSQDSCFVEKGCILGLTILLVQRQQ